MGRRRSSCAGFSKRSDKTSSSGGGPCGDRQGYATAAILILALGIGANTAMFSVIDGVLMKPLPFRQGAELVLVQQSAPGSNVQDASVSIPELVAYRQRLTAVRDLVEYHSMSFVMLNQGEPDRVDTGVVSANFFEMLGITPALGRTFIDTDDDLGVEPVLVLSHEYWQQKFGGDKNVVGKIVEMNDHMHTIVGVLPAFPQYPRSNDVYMPTSACPFRAQGERTMQQNHRTFAGLRVFGRLTSGATAERASAEVGTIASGFDDAYPRDYQRAREFTGRAQPLQEQLVSNARPMLLAISGATMLVLLIACANVANLALARSVRRGREMALRAALAPGRGRLLRQLVTESVILSLAGGAIGIGLAWLSLDLLVTFIGRFTSRTQQIGIDGGVLAFALGASLLTGIIAGALPALSARRNLAHSMRDGGSQAGESGGRQRLRAVLVVAQVAVSFILLVGAALLLQSFYRLSAKPLGYQTGRGADDRRGVRKFLTDCAGHVSDPHRHPGEAPRIARRRRRRDHQLGASVEYPAGRDSGSARRDAGDRRPRAQRRSQRRERRLLRDARCAAARGTVAA